MSLLDITDAIEVNSFNSMMVPDKEWTEANSLAGLFKKIVEDCKVRQHSFTIPSLWLKLLHVCLQFSFYLNAVNLLS